MFSPARISASCCAVCPLLTVNCEFADNAVKMIAKSKVNFTEPCYVIADIVAVFASHQGFCRTGYTAVKPYRKKFITPPILELGLNPKTEKVNQSIISCSMFYLYHYL